MRPRSSCRASCTSLPRPDPLNVLSVRQDGASASELISVAEIPQLPHDELPTVGVGGRIAYDLIPNELLLDGSARLHLATFVTTPCSSSSPSAATAYSS